MILMGFTWKSLKEKKGNPIHGTLVEVTSEVAIKGFGGATLLSTQPKETAELLENVMGLEEVGEEGDFIRFRSTLKLEISLT